MVGKWPSVEIGSVADIYDGPHATPPMVEDGPIFLGIDALDDGRLNLDCARHVSEEIFRDWTRRVVPTAGDLVFSYETRIGQAALIPPGLRCCLGRRLGLVRPKSEGLNSRYLLYYYLSPSFQDHLRAHTKPGSTVDRIHLNDFPRFPIAMPPRRHQDEIADLLGSLDDKIELNRRMAETLEAMARALFKSWFEASGEAGSVVVQSWIDSGILQIGDGYRAKNDELAAPGLPFLRAADINGGIDTATADTLSQASVSKAGSKVSRPGDVAFTSKGTVGRFARVDDRTLKFVYSPQLLLAIARPCAPASRSSLPHDAKPCVPSPDRYCGGSDRYGPLCFLAGPAPNGSANTPSRSGQIRRATAGVSFSTGGATR